MCLYDAKNIVFCIPIFCIARVASYLSSQKTSRFVVALLLGCFKDNNVIALDNFHTVSYMLLFRTTSLSPSKICETPLFRSTTVLIKPHTPLLIKEKEPLNYKSIGFGIQTLTVNRN